MADHTEPVGFAADNAVLDGRYFEVTVTFVTHIEADSDTEAHNIAGAMLDVENVVNTYEGVEAFTKVTKVE